MRKSRQWIVILAVFCVIAGATAPVTATEGLPGPVKRRMQQYKHIKTGLWMNVFTELDIYYEGDATSRRYKYGTLAPGRKMEILRWNSNMTMVRLDNGQIAFVRRKIIDPRKQRTRAKTFKANRTTPPRPGEKPKVTASAQRPPAPADIPLPVPRPERQASNKPETPQVPSPPPVVETPPAPPVVETPAETPLSPPSNLPGPVKERMRKYSHISTGLWMDVVNDLDIYYEGDGTSERYKYGTLKPGRKFEVIRWNEHMTMVRLDDGQIAYVRRRMIDPKKEGAKNWKERAEKYADLLKGNGQETAQAPVPPLPARRPEVPAEKPAKNSSVPQSSISLPGTIVTNDPLDAARLARAQAQEQTNQINSLSPAPKEICTTCSDNSRKLTAPKADPASAASLDQSAQPTGTAADFLNALSCESLDNEKFQCYRDNIHRLNEYYATRRGGFGSSLSLGSRKAATKMLGQCYKYVKMADSGPGKRCGFTKDYADLSAKNAKYTLPKMTGMIDLFELNDKNPYLKKLLKDNNLPPVDPAFAKEIIKLLSNKSKPEIRPIGGVQILKPTRYRANSSGGDKHGHIEVKTSVYTYASDGRRASPGDVWIGNRTLYGYMMRPEVFLNAYRSYIHGKLPGGKAQCAAKIKENTGFHMTASSYRSKPVNRSRTAGGRL